MLYYRERSKIAGFVAGVKMEMNITDLQHNRFFVKINETLSIKLDSTVSSKYKSYNKLAKILSIWPGSLYSWHKNKSYPLTVLIEICKSCGIDLKNEQTNVIEVRSCFYTKRKSNYVKSKPIYPKFPIKLTSELSSIVGHLFCDGSVSTSKEGYINVHYYNTNKDLLESFKNNVKEIFGNIHIYQSKNKGVDFVRLPSAVGIVLKLFVTDFGSKTCKIPDFIKEGNLEIKKAFIRAFADDEGSVSFRPPHRYIELACSNYQMLSDLKYLLNDTGIGSSKIYHKTQRGFDFYWFHVRGFAHIKNFDNKIGFSHPEKSLKMKQILESPQKIRFGQEESKRLVLDLLNEGKNRMEIARNLNRNVSTVDYHIRILRRNGLVKSNKNQIEV